MVDQTWIRCGVCLEPVSDEECRHNYIDHPHDGHWCDRCLQAYCLPRAQALALLRSRLHPQSWLTVDAA